MAIILTVQGKGSITDGDVFIFPTDEELTGDDINAFITANDDLAKNKYLPAKKMYLGQHQIIDDAKKDHGPDNRLVGNLAHYIVDTYNGFYIGIPPKITLDNTQDNAVLQEWNDTNSVQDKLSEISKQASIYGRALAFLYQDENSNTCIAYSSPINSFIIYDDTVAHKAIAFVMYWHDEDNNLTGKVYLKDGIYALDMVRFEGTAGFNPFNDIPAVEFFMNTERQGIFENVETLIDALDKVLSQKANQNEYFDNAYLVIRGMSLPEDDDGNPKLDLNGNQIIYSPDADSTNGVAEFLTKPDGDAIQEHLIDRLISMIYQISMVANLNDEAFSGNSSGVALQYKLLPMRNLAANQDRKFTQSLRSLYKIAFSVGTILPESKADDWQKLNFAFTRNLPENIIDEADAASKLKGLVSDQTMLSTLSFVDDPKAELKRIADETAKKAKDAATNSPSNADFQKLLNGGGNDDNNESTTDSE
ncbi:phage portal protein [Lacticaseibacillus paracasei]|uniref:phage portal protein n=1 Tax=Lacticaseibacillus paracasei TaxID=1597 RepID=UPI00399114F4